MVTLGIGWRFNAKANRKKCEEFLLALNRQFVLTLVFVIEGTNVSASLAYEGDSGGFHSVKGSGHRAEIGCDMSI